MAGKLILNFLDSDKWNLDTINRTKTNMAVSFEKLYEKLKFDGVYPIIILQKPGVLVGDTCYPMRYVQQKKKIYLSSDQCYMRLEKTRDISVAIALAYYGIFAGGMHVCVVRNQAGYYPIRMEDPTQDAVIINICKRIAASVILELFKRKVVVN